MQAAGPNVRASLNSALQDFDEARCILQDVPTTEDSTLFEIDMQSIKAALKMTFCKNLKTDERLRWLQVADGHCHKASRLSETTTMPEVAQRVRMEKAILYGRRIELCARGSQKDPMLIRMEGDGAIEGLERAMQDFQKSNEGSYHRHRERAEGWLSHFKKATIDGS